MANMAGRLFAPGEDVPGRNNVVLLSHRLWQAEAASASAESDREKLAEELSELLVVQAARLGLES